MSKSETQGARPITRYQRTAASSTMLVIPEDAKVTGKVCSAGNLRIDGNVEGEIEIQGDLILGAKAEVKGTVIAGNISIGGRINANLIIKELMEITSSGKLYGDVLTSYIRIEEGGVFVGKCRHSA
jgi:cytoskeletal protein CcmA (bactofilin family)